MNDWRQKDIPVNTRYWHSSRTFWRKHIDFPIGQFLLSSECNLGEIVNQGTPLSQSPAISMWLRTGPFISLPWDFESSPSGQEQEEKNRSWLIPWRPFHRTRKQWLLTRPSELPPCSGPCFLCCCDSPHSLPLSAPLTSVFKTGVLLFVNAQAWKSSCKW